MRTAGAHRDKQSRKVKKVWASFCSTSTSWRKTKLRPLCMKNKHPQEQKSIKKKNNNHVHMRRLPHIAHVLLDSSVSVEYPDWIKGGLWGREDSLRKKTKTEDWGHTGKNWELKLILIFPPMSASSTKKKKVKIKQKKKKIKACQT